MGERERTQEYGNEIHCHVYTFAKFQENTTILSYIHIQIIPMNIQYQKNTLHAQKAYLDMSTCIIITTVSLASD